MDDTPKSITSQKIKPVMIMFAGPNGSGKSTTVQSFLKENPVVFINPDDIGRKITYAAQANTGLTSELIEVGKSFIDKEMEKKFNQIQLKVFIIKTRVNQ